MKLGPSKIAAVPEVLQIEAGADVVEEQAQQRDGRQDAGAARSSAATHFNSAILATSSLEKSPQRQGPLRRPRAAD